MDGAPILKSTERPRSHAEPAFQFALCIRHVPEHALGVVFADDGTFFVTSHVAGTLTRFNGSSPSARTWRITGSSG